MIGVNRATGLFFSKVMKFTHKKGFIDRESFVAQYIAISIFTIGAASTLGLDDLLATFAAGIYSLFQVLTLRVLIELDRKCNILGWPFQPTH